MNAPFVVSLRLDSTGGGVRDRVLFDYQASRPRQKLLLLVHGFNRTEAEAAKTVELFAERCEALMPSLSNDIGVLYWPGDSNSLGVRGAAFPGMIKVAKNAATPFANYLKNLRFCGRRTEIVIVAHSLGCRLVLEGLYELASDEGKGRKITTILMAAAVPVGYADEHKFKKVQECFPRLIALHSSDDRILKLLFPIGSGVGEPSFGRLPEAIGLNGRPHKAFLKEKKMPAYGHGTYWTRTDEIPQTVAGLSGHLRGKTLHSRVIAGEDRSLPERQISTRSYSSIRASSILARRATSNQPARDAKAALDDVRKTVSQFGFTQRDVFGR